jgi:acyl-CoA synthetase (AMP-forming)/AMP-acid ligase II
MDRAASVPELLGGAAAAWGEDEFLRFPSRSVSFVEAHRIAGRVAAFLRARGLDTGDRVAIMLPNVPAWPLTWLGVLSAGLVAVPVNAAYRAADLAHVLADSGARVLVAAPELEQTARAGIALAGADVEVVDPATMTGGADPSPGDVVREPGLLANLQYTSGTTGMPKACELGHDYWLTLGALAAELAQITRDDVTLTSQPFSYIDPMWNCLMALTAGIPLVVLPRFSASGFMRSVRQHGVTTLYVLGTMPALLLKQPPTPHDRDNRLRLVWCSGIPAERHRELEERWGAPWREAYGLTESGVDLYVPVPHTASVGSGILGFPVPGKRIRVVDADGRDAEDGSAGQLLVQGTPMMRGYWNRPAETAEALADGWMHTGDLVTRDANATIRLVGRTKDMIRRGGENVAAAEVETALLADPSVRVAAVVAEADELFGEEVKAVIVLQEGIAADEATARAITGRLSQRLAGFKVPRFVEFATSLPMTPSERVAKAELKARRAEDIETVFDLGVRRSGAHQPDVQGAHT